jgi:uncharacterized membrane protein
MMMNADLEPPISLQTNTNARTESALKSSLLLPTQMTIVTPILTVTTTKTKVLVVKTEFAREPPLEHHVTMTINAFLELSVTQPSTNARLSLLLEQLAIPKDHLLMLYAD